VKFKFTPRGEYHPQQIIQIAGKDWMVESVAHTGRSLTAITPFKGYKNMAKFERILVVLTDSPPIEEIRA